MTSPSPSLPALVARLRAAGCVFAEDEAALLLEEATTPTGLEQMVARRVAGEPLEQVLGWAEFAGLRIRLLPGVFVPRRRSLLLVAAAVEHLTRGVRGSGLRGGPEGLCRWGQPVGAIPGTDATRASASPDGSNGLAPTANVPDGPPLSPDPRTPPLVLDLGFGSGALGAAVAARVPEAEVWAVDVDPAAVACARLNLEPERVLLGDLVEPLPAQLRFDVVLANVPYVPTDAIALMPPEARDHEHRVALDGGDDGLDVQRRAIGPAARRLRAGGILLLESGAEQAPLTATEMRSAGLVPEILRDEEAVGRAVLGRSPLRRVLDTEAEGRPPPTGGRPSGMGTGEADGSDAESRK